MWHVACIPLFSGCLYVKPIQFQEANRAPQVVFPENASDPIPLLVLSAPKREVYVKAFDPDGDILTFDWEVPRAQTTAELDEQTTEEDSGNWKSRVFIPREYLVDGESISVAISDQGEPRAVVTVQWAIQVLGS